MKITDKYAYEVALERLKSVYRQIASLELQKAELEGSLKFFAEKHFYDEEMREQKEREEMAEMRRKAKEGSK